MLSTLFEQDAVELAKSYGLRQRSMSFVQLALLLVLGWWKQPQAGQSALARFAGSLGVSLEKQDVDCHFTERTASWLLALLRRAVQRVVTAQTLSLPLLQQFTAVLIEDGSSISLPSALKSVWGGCGGSQSKLGKDAKTEAGLKITVRWDLLRGQLHGPYVQEGRRHELKSVLREQQMPKGSLWIADLGYWTLAWLHHLHQQGVYFLMRYKVGIVLWYHNERLDLLSMLPSVVGERLELAKWTLLISNVPSRMLSFEQALALVRARWQIELLFKLWKQHGLLDEWNATNPWRILCEVYAKLVAMVVQHWFVLLSCWDDPHHSLSSVAEVLREQVPTLVHGMTGAMRLGRAVRLITQSIRGGCSIPKRSTRLSTSYRLLSTLESGLT
jgi:hypothetical protein